MKNIINIFIAVFVMLALTAPVGIFGQDNDKCPECKGTGKSKDKCAVCNGSGKDPVSAMMGFNMICGYCKGSGTMICFYCYGTGKYSEYQKNANSAGVQTPAPAQPQNQTPPPSNSGNTGNGILCTSCGGTGTCSTCKGNYWSNCSYCKGVGKKTYGTGTNQSYENCVVCKGSGKSYCGSCYDNPYFRNPGKCNVCKGKGRV